MGCITSRFCRDDDWRNFDQEDQIAAIDRPFVQMVAPGNDASNFADFGDKVVLYVNFGEDCFPCRLSDDVIDHTSAVERVRDVISNDEIDIHGQRRYNYEVLIAKQVAELIKLHPAQQDSTTYKAVINIPLHNSSVQDGQPIPIRLPYMRDQQYTELSERDINPKYTVYFQSLWRQLKDHITSNITRSHSSALQRPVRRGYGSMGETSHGDEQDAVHVDSVEQQEIAYQNENKPKRYWPDSWQMKCWGACCDFILRSDKPIPKFIAQFFVAPLTNVTGLSLHYQLYLSEIFHTKFWTRLGHYLCMPLIVLMILVFCAQIRFSINNDVMDCYKINNFEVLVFNGAVVLGVFYFFWYLFWGVVEKNYFMGIFMILPLTVLVILANIYFQLAIKNTMKIDHKPIQCDVCWNHTIYGNGVVHFYNIFSLMKWYFNPVVWAGILSMFQSLSHIFEPKIPPRVSQTAHWLSCSYMCARMGYTKTLCILSAQAFFGAVDEFLASPRLLPIFVLRVCYELGYNNDEWKWMKKLVKKCMEYGDPALDYIGVGGSSHPSTSSIVFKDQLSIGDLKKEVLSMKQSLTSRQRKILVDPKAMSSYRKSGRTDPFLQHYVTLRHYVAQYNLQVYAYGPFRLRHDDYNAELDNARMNRDFEKNPRFYNFLRLVRFGLWRMEDDLVNKRNLSGCCEPDLEEVRVM